MKIITYVFLIVFSAFAMADEGYKTEIEKFMDRKDVVIHVVSSPLGEYEASDNKNIEFHYMEAREIGKEGVVSGIEILVSKRRDSKVLESSYIDSAEIDGLIGNLKTIWNFTPSSLKDGIGVLSFSTKSNFSVLLFELNEEQQKKADFKRFVIVAAGDAYEDLITLKDFDDFDDIDGLAILPLEGVKDIISILERAAK